MNDTPRPVRLASRILGALAAIFGVIPMLGSEFGFFEWTTGQVNAYTVTVGTLIGAASLVLGVRVERVVTPTSNPRDDAGNLLTPGPIGSDNPDAFNI